MSSTYPNKKKYLRECLMVLGYSFAIPTPSSRFVALVKHHFGMQKFSRIRGLLHFGSTALQHFGLKFSQDTLPHSDFPPVGSRTTSSRDSAGQRERIEESLIRALSFEGTHGVSCVAEQGYVSSFFQ